MVPALALLLAIPKGAIRLPAILIHLPDTYRGPFLEAMRESGVYIDFVRQGEAIRPGLDLSGYKLILLYRVVPARYAALKPALEAARAKGAKVMWARGRGADPFIATCILNPCKENFARMLRYMASKYFDIPFEVEPPLIFPELALYRPREGLLEVDDFLSRHPPSPKGAVAVVLFHKVFFTTGNMALIDSVIEALEREGFQVLATYSEPLDILKELTKRGVKPDVLVKLRVLRLSFKRPFEGVELLKRLEVPLLCPVRVSMRTLADWRRSAQGLDPLDLTFLVTIPEVDGAIEPLVVGGKTFEGEFHREVPLPEGVTLLARRARKWGELRRLPNPKKRVAVIYWIVNPHAPGPGAAYLDVPLSLHKLLSAMAEEGFKVEGLPPPEEMASLLSSPPRVRIPLDKYLSWLKGVDPGLRRALFQKWGRPKRDIEIRALILGNVVVAPQPPRVKGPNLREALHSRILPPPHEYVALYLWLANEFGADAVVHLGTHGTLEFLPGRETGLSTDDWPLALIGHLPNIYVYNCVNVGEAMTAKRRSLAVIVSHNIPKFERMGLSGPLSALKRLIMLYRSSEGELQKAYLKRILEQAGKMGLIRKGEGKEAIPRLWERICEIEEEESPAGLHILEEHEIRAVLRALRGSYIEPSPGGDPFKNPAVLPTGRNLYSIDPRAVPTEAAFEVGRRMAEDLLSRMRKRLGRIPRKIGFTLWAGETVRQHGVLESMILWLLGIRPVWDRRGYVVGLEIVPEGELGRPRVDVVITVTGVYRDLFPEVILLLHRAVRMAARAGGRNFVKENVRAIREALIRGGIPPAEADRLATVRIFSEAPGEYGTRLNEAIEAGIHEEKELADLYLGRMGHAYGEGIWGKEAREVFEEALKGTEAVVMSRSSKLYGVLDVDEAFQYLGGMGLGASALQGEEPMLFIANLRGEGRLETLPEFMAREVFSRYLNPRWIKAMMRHGRSGALAMLEFVENLFAWRILAPGMVPEGLIEQAREVYIKDALGLGLKKWLRRSFPEAWRRIKALLLMRTESIPSPSPRVRITPLPAEALGLPSRQGRGAPKAQKVFLNLKGSREVKGVRLVPSARPRRKPPPVSLQREASQAILALWAGVLMAFLAGFLRGIKAQET